MAGIDRLEASMPFEFGNKIRLTAVLNLGTSVTFMNVYELRCLETATNPDTAVMAELAAWLDSAYQEINAYIPNVVTYTEVRGFNETLDQPMPAVAWPALGGGGASGEYMPTGVAGLVIFRTLKARVLGRKFLGPLSEGAIASGELIAAALLALAAYAIEIRAGPTMTAGNGQFEYGVYDQLGVFRSVFSSVVRSVAAYQRRRRPGAGI
jgi:hypothetical protein